MEVFQGDGPDGAASVRQADGANEVRRLHRNAAEIPQRRLIPIAAFSALGLGALAGEEGDLGAER